MSAAPPRWAGRERSPRALQRGVGHLPRPPVGNAVPPAPPFYPPCPCPQHPRSDMRAWSRDMLAGLTLALAPRRSPEAYGSPAHRQRCPTGPFSTSSWARPRPSGCPSCSLSGAAAVDGQRCPRGAATAGQSRRGGRAHARGRTGAALGQDRGLEGPREGRAVGLPRQGCQGSSSPMLEGGLATPSARPAGMRLALPAAGSRVGAGWIAASCVRTLRRLAPQLPLSLRELCNQPLSPSAAGTALLAKLRVMLVASGWRT